MCLLDQTKPVVLFVLVHSFSNLMKKKKPYPTSSPQTSTLLPKSLYLNVCPQAHKNQFPFAYSPCRPK